MNLSEEYQRNMNDAIAKRVASHFTNAQRRVGLAAHGTLATPPFIQAQAQDLAHMTVDALALSAGTSNDIHPAFALVLSQLQQINSSLNTVHSRIDNLQNTVDNLQNTVDNLQNTVENLQSTVNIHIAEINSRLTDMNRTITSAVNTNALLSTNGFLLAFPNSANVAPDNFPKTSAEVYALAGPDMTALLQSYNITDIPHALAARRTRVLQLIQTGL